MVVRKWCLFIRGNGGKDKKYYYSIKDPRTGKYLSHRSARTSNKREAEKVAALAYEKYIAELDQTRLTAEMPLISFMEIMYDDEKSPLLLEKKERNANAFQSDHFRTMRSYYIRYLLKLIQKGMTIGKITPYELDQLQRILRANNPSLTPQTINAIFSSLLNPLRYAARKWIIPKDPTEGYKPYAPDRKNTGTFAVSEVEKLIALSWDDRVGKLAFLLAIFTGMRMGEVQGLRFLDLEARENESGFLPVVRISHSFSKTHGLKCPKNGKPRIVPIPMWLWYELRALNNRGGESDRFVFASDRNGNPVSDKVLRRSLEKALERIGVSCQQQEERNLRFHSTRHYFNSALAPLVQNESLRKVIGHSSPEMTAHYHHITDIELEMVAKAQSEAFQTIPFPAREEIA